MAPVYIYNYTSSFFLETFIRLVDGDDVNSGRVEVYYHGEWSTVCDDHFNSYAATVVCRMLGLPS